MSDYENIEVHKFIDERNQLLRAAKAVVSDFEKQEDTTDSIVDLHYVIKKIEND